jgi:hypothetical protein
LREPQPGPLQPQPGRSQKFSIADFRRAIPGNYRPFVGGREWGNYRPFVRGQAVTNWPEKAAGGSGHKRSAGNLTFQRPRYASCRKRGGLLFDLVPTEGVEPTHPYGYQILSLARLPIPPRRPMNHEKLARSMRRAACPCATVSPCTPNIRPNRQKPIPICPKVVRNGPKAITRFSTGASVPCAGGRGAVVFEPVFQPMVRNCWCADLALRIVIRIDARPTFARQGSCRIAFSTPSQRTPGPNTSATRWADRGMN